MSDAKTYPLMKDILGVAAVTIIADAGAAASPVFDRTAFLDAAPTQPGRLVILERVRTIAEALH